MVKFVLVSAPRSGTNLLRGTIGCHPRGRLIGEIFYEDPATWGLHEELDSDQARVDEAQALTTSDPIRFLEAYGFAVGKRAAAASGFTLMYDQPGPGSRSIVLNWIASRRDIRILHLRRRNELRR
jgi:hypothetical protein